MLADRKPKGRLCTSAENSPTLVTGTSMQGSTVYTAPRHMFMISAAYITDLPSHKISLACQEALLEATQLGEGCC